jgi:hypothetical protein
MNPLRLSRDISVRERDVATAIVRRQQFGELFLHTEPV